jgi:uncharacterized protein (DUF433 family)
MPVTVLDRELYSITYAARVLKMSPSTLHWWLEGRDHHPPVIRERATGSKLVTWGELVEARWLQLYRRSKQVPLPRIRVFVDYLRRATEVPYPLAHYQPFVGERRRLILEGQRVAELPTSESVFLEVTSGQLVLTGGTEIFLEQVDFASEGEQWAERIHPEGRRSPIVIDPAYSSGAATIHGIRTEVIAELDEAGEDREEIAKNFSLKLSEVKAAISYELRAAV